MVLKGQEMVTWAAWIDHLVLNQGCFIALSGMQGNSC